MNQHIDPHITEPTASPLRASDVAQSPRTPEQRKVRALELAVAGSAYRQMLEFCIPDGLEIEHHRAVYDPARSTCEELPRAEASRLCKERQDLHFLPVGGVSYLTAISGGGVIYHLEAICSYEQNFCYSTARQILAGRLAQLAWYDQMAKKPVTFRGEVWLLPSEHGDQVRFMDRQGKVQAGTLCSMSEVDPGRVPSKDGAVVNVWSVNHFLGRMSVSRTQHTPDYIPIAKRPEEIRSLRSDRAEASYGPRLSPVGVSAFLAPFLAPFLTPFLLRNLGSLDALSEGTTEKDPVPYPQNGVPAPPPQTSV